jgi:hypothetical protein
MSSGGLDFLAGVLRPGGGLVVERAGLQASVQDADEPLARWRSAARWPAPRARWVS